MGVDGKRIIIGPHEGDQVPIGDGIAAVFKLEAVETAGAFVVVEHPVAPGVMVMPHTHEREDEFSFILDGEIGVRIGDRIATATAGSYVLKPRGVPHTFWNATDRPARILEIISPPGFERFFRDAAALAELGASAEDPRWSELGERYGLRFHDEWLDELEKRYRVRAV